METTLVLGFYGDNGKENGNYHDVGVLWDNGKENGNYHNVGVLWG